MWALGEIVKAQAGILEGDSPEDVAAKIQRAVGDALPGSSDATWIEPQLLALVGQGAESELGGDRRGQSFAAWRRFLEGLAEQRQLVLVIEDLHWADESMLDFVDELVDWVTDVPLLVVGTARPELLSRRAGWAGGKLNATTVALSPLTDEQTALLIGGLLARPVIADEQQRLLEQAGGNPLYAEQFAELYLERGSAEDLPLPETLQGIIAARLDGLEAAEKELLQDAAVVGKVFWSGSLGRDSDSASDTLHSLARKGFVRRERRTSIENESEYTFAHALVRDVAYGQIPRAERATKHRAVAEWIESLGRSEDHAEMLAYHWGSALELAQVSGGADKQLAGHARTASALAGDRAASLNAYTAAAGHYARALQLADDDDRDVPALLFKRAEALFNAGDEEAQSALEQTRAALIPTEETTAAGETEALLARLAWYRGDLRAMSERLRSAEALVAGRPPALGVARVLAWSARQEMLTGDQKSALRRAEDALAMAELLDLTDLRIHALTTIGSARFNLGDLGGRRELDLAIEMARSTGSPLLAGALNNLAVVLDQVDLGFVAELQRESLEAGERFGDANIARFARGNLIPVACIRGEWDECVRNADAFIAECEQGAPHVLEGPARQFRGYIRLARGEREPAFDDLDRALELARGTGEDPDTMVPALIRNAWGRLQVGQVDDARALFAEAVPLLEVASYTRPWTIAEVAFDLGEIETTRRIVNQRPTAPGNLAMLAVLDGDFERAAQLYGETGVLLFEAEARLRFADQLSSAGRGAEAASELGKALAFYRPLGAVLFVERGERLLAEAAMG